MPLVTASNERPRCWALLAFLCAATIASVPVASAQAPGTPGQPWGPTTVPSFEWTKYCVSGGAPAGDEYIFHWGDGTTASTFGTCASHSWTLPERYCIRVAAINIWTGETSPLGPCLQIDVVLVDPDDPWVPDPLGVHGLRVTEDAYVPNTSCELHPSALRSTHRVPVTRPAPQTAAYGWSIPVEALYVSPPRDCPLLDAYLTVDGLRVPTEVERSPGLLALRTTIEGPPYHDGQPTVLPAVRSLSTTIVLPGSTATFYWTFLHVPNYVHVEGANAIVYFDNDGDGTYDPGEERVTAGASGVSVLGHDVEGLADPRLEAGPDGSYTVYNDVDHDGEVDQGEAIVTIPAVPLDAKYWFADGCVFVAVGVDADSNHEVVVKICR